MRKFIVILAALMLAALPALAQEETPEPTDSAPASEEVTPQENLPPGCNVSTLSDIFGNASEGLAQQDITSEDAVFIIDMLDQSLTAMRNACAPDEAPVDENAFDYSSIPQSRTEDGAFILGDPEAPITIVEFADYLCPHCQTYHETIKQVIVNYVATGQARVEYRFFPVIDPDLSPLTARMTECADILKPGSFWQAYDVMYELAAARFNSLMPFTYAARTGLNYDDLVTCVSEQANQIGNDAQVGQEAGITGTPSVLVRYGNGELENIVDEDGQAVNSASVPYLILSTVIEQAQEE